MFAIKAFAIWLLILVCAVINGAFREGFLVPHFGMVIAFVLSGLLLSSCIMLVSIIVVPWFHRLDGSRLLLLGSFWVSLTLIFEFSFGRLAQHTSWPRLIEAYTFRNGNLWPIVLVVTLFAPWLAARVRGSTRGVAK
jgi:hypothetical protein